MAMPVPMEVSDSGPGGVIQWTVELDKHGDAASLLCNPTRFLPFCSAVCLSSLVRSLHTCWPPSWHLSITLSHGPVGLLSFLRFLSLLFLFSLSPLPYFPLYFLFFFPPFTFFLLSYFYTLLSLSLLSLSFCFL